MLAEKIYTSIPPFCFICPFCLCSSSVKTGTSFGQHLKMFERMFFFLLLKTRPTAWSVKMVWFHLMFILFPSLLFGLLGPGISNQDHLYTMLPWGGCVRGFPIAAKRELGNNDNRKQSIPKQLRPRVCSMDTNPSPVLSLKSSSGTFGQESLFPLWPGNQRVLRPDRRSTADQTGRVPLEWHLEPLQGMRAPLISSHLVRTTVCQG